MKKVHLKIGVGDRFMSISVGFTTYRWFKSKNWEPFFYGPHGEEQPPGAYYFGALGFSIDTFWTSGKDVMDCHYEVANDSPRHRAVFCKKTRVYDAYEIDGDRYELIDTIDKNGVKTKHRDSWHDGPEAMANRERNEANRLARNAAREAAANKAANIAAGRSKP